MNFKSKKNRNEKAITLIALVITIIVLLILAGVSIAMLTGENGILKQANEAKIKHEEGTEKEKIEILLLGGYENTIDRKGLALKKASFTSNEGSHIYDSITGKEYADGWYYVKKGEENLVNSYIANYEKQEYIVFDETVHRIIDHQYDCIKEGLIFTADPRSIGEEGNWGDAILHNFVPGEANSGWTSNALMFDGVDDGIEVIDQSDYTKGITIEMYIKLKGRTENQNAQILTMKRSNNANGYFMYLGNEDETYRRLTIDIGGAGENRLNTNVYIEENKPTYITYTYDPNKATEKGVLYINNVKTQTTEMGNINKLMEAQQKANIQIGSDIHETNGPNYRYPFYGDIYSARIYTRALTQAELTYNYNTTINSSNE